MPVERSGAHTGCDGDSGGVSAETYSALKSYEFQGATTAVTTTGENASTSAETFTVVFSAPDQFVVDFRYPGQGSWTRASNGKTTTEIRTATRSSTSAARHPIRHPAFSTTPPLGFTTISTRATESASVEGSEKVTVDGQDVDCWVIQTDRDMGILPDGVKRTPTRLWVDRSAIPCAARSPAPVRRHRKQGDQKRPDHTDHARSTQPSHYSGRFVPRPSKKK